jgi:sterol desaturase/sphingolipid hydroxylase (fatty acid hydroxylase superfamily)
MNDPTATKYFCLSLSLSNFYSNSLCSPYKNLFIKIILLEVIIPLTISILKFLFTELMKYLVEVRRHANQIKKFESQIVATFIFYFIVSGLLQLVINLEVITSSSTAISIRSVF